MPIQAISTPASPPVVASPPPSTTTLAVLATSHEAPPITDSVTLSANAQALLRGAASPPATPAGIWATDAVKQALVALDDTSGKTAVTDQISAFRTVNSLIADNANFDTDAKRGEAAKVMTAFEGSAYAKHLQDVYANINQRQVWDGIDVTPESLRNTLDAFNALSSDDQQTFCAANELCLDLTPLAKGRGPDGFASVDSYRANLTAQIGVQREYRTALADPVYAKAVDALLSHTPGPGED